MTTSPTDETDPMAGVREDLIRALWSADNLGPDHFPFKDAETEAFYRDAGKPSSTRRADAALAVVRPLVEAMRAELAKAKDAAWKHQVDAESTENEKDRWMERCKDGWTHPDEYAQQINALRSARDEALERAAKAEGELEQLRSAIHARDALREYPPSPSAPPASPCSQP